MAINRPSPDWGSFLVYSELPLVNGSSFESPAGGGTGGGGGAGTTTGTGTGGIGGAGGTGSPGIVILEWIA